MQAFYEKNLKEMLFFCYSTKSRSKRYCYTL